MTYICMDDGEHEDRNALMSTCCSLCDRWHAISPCVAGHRVGRIGDNLFRKCEVGKPCTPCGDFVFRRPKEDSITFNGDMRCFLGYLAEEGAGEYIRSALRAYDLIVHEFGPDVVCRFTMNYHDYMSPMLKVDYATIPKDLQGDHADEIMKKIDKIRETLHNLIPYTGAKITLVTMG